MAQAFQCCGARACERLLVTVKLESPIGGHFEGIDFESKLRRVSLFVELSVLLGIDDDLPQCTEPLLHNLCNAITNWSWPAIELGRSRCEKAATAKHFVT